MTEKLYDGKTFEETIVILLYLSVQGRWGLNGNERAYLSRMREELFE